MLTSYRRVLSVPGALRFSTTGLIARLPVSMVGLGIVLLVSRATGSYGTAGAVAATYVLANAALAIAHGRFADRFGQATALPGAIAVFAASMSLMMWAVQTDRQPLAFAAAALAGASLPQVGSCVRARWSYVLDSPGQVQTAYALEAVVDEAVFILGPILVTLLATAWHPVAGLAVAVVAGTAGTLALAAQRDTEPPAHRGSHGATGIRPAMPWRTVIPLTIVSLAIGALFGSAEVATVAFAEELDAARWTGGLLALWALGSLTSGVVTGAVNWRIGPAARVQWGIFVLTLALAPLVLISSLWVMAVALLFGGLAISPTLIATMALVEQEVPRARLTEGMAVLHTGMAGGVAPGAAIAGLVIDAHGASASYLVPLAAGLLGAAASLTLRRAPARGHYAASHD